MPDDRSELVRQLRTAALRNAALVALAYAFPPTRRLAHWYLRTAPRALLIVAGIGFAAGYLGVRRRIGPRQQ